MAQGKGVVVVVGGFVRKYVRACRDGGLGPDQCFGKGAMRSATPGIIQRTTAGARGSAPCLRAMREPRFNAAQGKAPRLNGGRPIPWPAPVSPVH